MWLFGDSFDIYQLTDNVSTPSTDIASHWNSAGIGLVQSADPTQANYGQTRFSHGKAAWMHFGSTLLRGISPNEGTLFVSFAAYFKTEGTATASDVGFRVTLTDPTGNQMGSVIFQKDQSIRILAGPCRDWSTLVETGTDLSVTPSAFTQNRWYWVQIKFTAATLPQAIGGSIDVACQSTFSAEVRLDGSLTATASGSGTDVTNTGVATAFPPGAIQTTSFEAWDSSQSMYLDDVMIWSDHDGNPSGWSEILRFELKNPNGNRSTKFTPFPAVNTFGSDQPTDAPVTLSANTILYSAITYPRLAHSGVAQSITIPIAGTFPGPRFKAALYKDNGAGLPGVLLGVTSEAVGFNGTPVDLPFTSPIIVTRDQIYHFAFLCDTALDPSGLQGPLLPGAAGTIVTNVSNSSQAVTSYADGFPTVASSTSGFAACFGIINVASNDNFSFVSGPSQLPHPGLLEAGTYDDYVVANTLNDFDLYNIEPLSGTPTIIGVQTRTYMASADAGIAKASVMLQSGTATAFKATGTILPADRTWETRFDNVDPATGSPFTPAAVDNIAIGVIDLTGQPPAS